MFLNIYSVYVFLQKLNLILYIKLVLVKIIFFNNYVLIYYIIYWFIIFFYKITKTKYQTISLTIN